MAYTLHLIQIISSVALIGLVLLQRTQGDTGSSLGGDNASFFQTRRGAERFLFLLTVAVGVVFVGSSLAVIIL
jgi:protein translocase SecG subunit